MKEVIDPRLVRLRECAIAQAIRRSVEDWINGDMEGANRCFEMAIKFDNAPLELFNPEETHV